MMVYPKWQWEKMIILWKGIPIIDEMRNVPSQKGMNTD